MITPVHILFDFFIYLIFGSFIETSWIDLVMILSVNLIDLDHLTAKPIYKPGRNSFKTHLLHKNWKALTIIAIILLFIRPALFLGLGVLSHFFLDFLDFQFRNQR